MKCPLCDGTGEMQQCSEALPTTKLGRFLQEGRKSKRLSLRDVETITGISNALISQMETGKIKHPSFGNVMSLCDVYGIEPRRLTQSKGGSE